MRALLCKKKETKIKGGESTNKQVVYSEVKTKNKTKQNQTKN